MSLNIDWAHFHHLSEHHREVAGLVAQGLGEQALDRLLGSPHEQHVAQLEQFEAFVLGQRRAVSEAQGHAAAESVTQTQDELRHEQARSEALKGLLGCSLPSRISRGPFGWTRPS